MPKERPIIKNIISDKTLTFETFQNVTLRPIIKMQHDLILALFQSYVQKKKIDFGFLENQSAKDKIKSIFEKDINFKYMILGAIVGHFSAEEFEMYNLNTAEFHKRIIQITIQRIQDTLLK
jgi:hypothetical protein